ncbi:MAG: family 43 glycosylhydrolase [bacterium]|nr:family 43 glycosylhydrolase [bacterium]MCM1375450.1 family 43 glycosylhydrolase [Muribaculum sp.]
MGYIRVYTGEVSEPHYPWSLADSVHMSYLDEDGREYPLNQGYGILYAEAEIRPDNTIAPRGVRFPRILELERGYGILARPVNSDGEPALEDELILWRTEDFLRFWQEPAGREVWRQRYDDAGDKVALPRELWDNIRIRWRMPDTELKPVEFPLAVGWADPVIFCWQGSWYFLATNDNNNNIGLFIRKAESVAELFAPDVEPCCILDYNEDRGLVQTFWAPEFHVIGGEAYILFAVSGQQWGPQCHMLRLKKGGSLTDPAGWEAPIRVCRQDGSYLTESGISLDMTYFQAGGRSYLVWSYRYGIGTPLDTGSMLYIATVDESTPWVLTSELVLLSRPLYGWENQRGTINNEGPYALLLEDKVYLAYSGGGACDPTYAVGYLVAEQEADLLDVDNWYKEPAAMLHRGLVEGIEGPGHNSFFRDEKGELMIAYHAQEREQYHKRCTTFHRVYINEQGMPLLQAPH